MKNTNSVNENHPSRDESPETLRAADEASDGVAGLLPCPFCGRAAIIKEVPSQVLSDSYWWAGCEIFGEGNPSNLVGCGIGRSSWSKVETISKWNTRAANWQPIETAPTQGRSFLVHCEERCNTYVVYRREPDAAFYHFGGMNDSLNETPHYWRPLPAHPATQETKTSEAPD